MTMNIGRKTDEARQQIRTGTPHERGNEKAYSNSHNGTLVEKRAPAEAVYDNIHLMRKDSSKSMTRIIKMCNKNASNSRSMRYPDSTTQMCRTRDSRSSRTNSKFRFEETVKNTLNSIKQLILKKLQKKQVSKSDESARQAEYSKKRQTACNKIKTKAKVRSHSSMKYFVTFEKKSQTYYLTSSTI